MDCLFCKIVQGDIPSAKVYEDADVVAFLDIHPLTKGHCLVIPKTHAENIFDINEAVLQKVITAGKKISINIQKTLHANGIQLSQSNGVAAGQEVMHFHLHIIPRYEHDGLTMHGSRNNVNISKEELDLIAQEIALS